MQAVFELFKVRPISCIVINVKSKPKMTRTKSSQGAGRTTPWKKAIVTLKAGEKIDSSSLYKERGTFVGIKTFKPKTPGCGRRQY